MFCYNYYFDEKNENISIPTLYILSHISLCSRRSWLKFNKLIFLILKKQKKKADIVNGNEQRS